MFALFNHFCLFQVTISNRRRRSLVSDDEAEVGDRDKSHLQYWPKKMAKNKKINLNSSLLAEHLDFGKILLANPSGGQLAAPAENASAILCIAT